jgi:Ca2+-transporting ATPase
MFNAKAFATVKSSFKGLGTLKGLKNNGGSILVAFVIFGGQILIVEFGGDVFRTVPLSLKDWAIIIGSSSFVLWIGEVIRFGQRIRKQTML